MAQQSEVCMSGRIGGILVMTLFVILVASAVSAERGRIYGRIHTDRGDILEGPIRWDKNEASWDDMIDGNKERPKKHDKKRRRKYGDDDGTRVKLFGLTIFSDGSGWGGSLSQSAIAFGHIKELIPDSDDGAELLLKSGETVFIEGSSSDLGTGVREIIIETADEGELELDWYDIDHIEFMDGGDVESDMGERIYGTVTTSRAGEYTGWICWDVDETFTKDIIDGRDKRRKRKIKFAKIGSIEKISSQASSVTTKDGKEIRLDDSNDVDSGNRGITISDRKLGRIIVEWDEFERLDLEEPPADAYVSYDDFDGGKRMFGTVYDEEGESFTGYIRWDDDEEFTWEILDGDYRDVNFDIAFGNIKSIEKLSRRKSRITLWDGRTFQLRGSNDVNDENKGIIIFEKLDIDEDDALYVDWEDFERIEFRE
jgi:hypothetical protein